MTRDFVYIDDAVEAGEGTFRAEVVVLEAEERLAAHQTGNNSGVIHSGLYYRPGSLKARNCVSGREAMYRFCRDNEIPHENCGKVVVATTLTADGEICARGEVVTIQMPEKMVTR